MFILYFMKVAYFQEYKNLNATIVGQILWVGPT